jgi:hypothetical protein
MIFPVIDCLPALNIEIDVCGNSPIPVPAFDFVEKYEKNKVYFSPSSLHGIHAF